jgi:2-keto-4-pentenoate hydratase/2-oxohepta-3-ene-1,7-dioic acid hydratase in catechol pathway
MKLCHYKINNIHGYELRLGILEGNSILDPQLVWESYFKKEGFYNYTEKAIHKSPSLLSEFLKLKSAPLEELQLTHELAENLKKQGIPFKTYKTSEVHLGKPLDKINTYRDFFTHEKHVKTGFEKRGEPVPQEWYQFPVYYKGATVNFIGPEDEILWPSFTDKLDYELELAAVMAKDAYNIKESDVYKHLLGYTILNDVSARDIQRAEMKVRLGPSKGKDFCSIIGPVIVTIDEFKYADPDVVMTAKINGTEWSRGKSSDSHYNFAQMIAFAGKDEWLLAGDLFGSGTVGTGCGLELDRWVKPGDEIELHVDKIGSLKNKVGKPVAPHKGY